MKELPIFQNFPYPWRYEQTQCCIYDADERLVCLISIGKGISTAHPVGETIVKIVNQLQYKAEELGLITQNQNEQQH